MAVTKIATEPLLSFLTKSTAFINIRTSSNNSNNNNISTNTLRSESFATPEKINVVLEELNQVIETKYRPTMSKMRLYLPNPTTQAMILKPITDQIVESLKQLRKLIDMHYTPGILITSISYFIFHLLTSFLFVLYIADKQVIHLQKMDEIAHELQSKLASTLSTKLHSMLNDSSILLGNHDYHNHHNNDNNNQIENGIPYQNSDEDNNNHKHTSNDNNNNNSNSSSNAADREYGSNNDPNIHNQNNIAATSNYTDLANDFSLESYQDTEAPLLLERTNSTPAQLLH